MKHFSFGWWKPISGGLTVMVDPYQFTMLGLQVDLWLKLLIQRFSLAHDQLARCSDLSAYKTSLHHSQDKGYMLA